MCCATSSWWWRRFWSPACVAVVVLELGSSAERRLVSRLRDVVEVLLPPALALVLVWIVWFDRI